MGADLKQLPPDNLPELRYDAPELRPRLSMHPSAMPHSSPTPIQLPPGHPNMGEAQLSYGGQKPAGGWSSAPPPGGGMGGMGGGMMGGGGGAQGPGSGPGASVGDLFSTFFLLAGKFFGPLFGAYAGLEIVKLLLVCPQWILLFMLTGAVAMDNETIGLIAGTGMLCANLVVAFGSFLIAGVQMGFLRAVRHTLVVGKDQVGGVGGVFSGAFKKTPAALVILLLGGIVISIGYGLCVIPGIILTPLVGLTGYLVVACDEPLGNALSEAVRLLKKNIGATIVWWLVATITLSVFYGCLFGMSFAAVEIGRYGGLVAGIVNFFVMETGALFVWLWSGAFVVTVETKDCNLTLVR